MKTSFLDYYKVILNKVSFDRELLKKEYCKAMSSLLPHEAQQLSRWAKEKQLLMDHDRVTI